MCGGEDFSGREEGGNWGNPIIGFLLWPWACPVGPSHLVRTRAQLGAPGDECLSAESESLAGCSDSILVSTCPLVQGHSRGSGSQTGAWGQPGFLCCAGNGSS